MYRLLSKSQRSNWFDILTTAIRKYKRENKRRSGTGTNTSTTAKCREDNEKKAITKNEWA
jgi:hypothetical protein